jgi:hypothetical protein
MSVSSGPLFASTANLALMLDATNPQSNVGNRSLINWNNWTVGSGGVTGYTQNGQTAENERVVASNPWETMQLFGNQDRLQKQMMTVAGIQQILL